MTIHPRQISPRWKGAIKRIGGFVARAVLTEKMRFVHNSWHYSWSFRPDLCPCDLHLCEYLVERNVRGQSIFHFGTGGHHLVGLRNRDDGLGNEILAITAAPAEHARYVSEVIRSPLLGRHYRVLFADIYDLCSASLPTFDLATLFHLGEFADAVQTPRRMDDRLLLDLLISKVVPGGRLLFYSGSVGYSIAGPLIDRAVAEGRLSFLESFKSLIVFRVAGIAPLAPVVVP
jgi:hypothetical protein